MKIKTLPYCVILTAICMGHFDAVTAANTDSLSDNVRITPLPAKVTERGAFYKVVETPVEVKNLLTGTVSFEDHAFTMLEDGMHYWENGQWLESKDLIEIKGDAAVALQSPGKAVFYPSTLAPVVVDYLTPEGQRLQSRVSGLCYFEEATGMRVQIAEVQEANGFLYPPNQIIYTNAFDSGVSGDIIYTVTKAGMEQDIALTGDLPDPESLGFQSSDIKLEIWTTFQNAPSAKITPKSVLRRPYPTADQTHQTVLLDDTIDFGGTWMPLGRAFLSYEELNARGSEPASIGLADPTNPDEVLVGKKWISAGKDAVLIESVDLTELKTKFKIKQQAALPTESGGRRAVASLKPTVNRAAKIQLAKTQYSPRGVIVDYSLKTGSASSFTFTNGATYLITNSFTVGDSGGGTATFQPNACIKYANNAYLTLIGGVTFQTNGSPTVFTAYDDNFYGERLPNSSGNPTNYASPAVSLYYIGYNRTIANALFRWAKRGISISESVAVSDTVKDSRFEYSYNGIYEYLPSGSLTLSGVTTMLVNSNIYVGSGYYSGSFTTDYKVVSNVRINDPSQDNASGDADKNSQSECSFVVVDTNRIVAAFFDTHLSEYALGYYYTNFTGITSPRSTGWSTSTNGGGSFTDQGPVLPLPSNMTQGDAGDPVMARDKGNGKIYLLMNPSREQNIGASYRLWLSTNDGQSFTLINTNIPSGARGADKPMIAVNNFSNSSNYHYLYLAGSADIGTNIGVTMITCSTNGGTNWDSGTVLSNDGKGADICIRSNGTVYVFWFLGGTTNYIKYKWLVPGGSWQGPSNLVAHINRTGLNSTNINGSGNPKRSNSAADSDYFVSNAFPRAAVNYAQDRIYVVYPDIPSTTPGNDHGDIYVQEGIPGSDGSISWSGEIKVNHDNTSTDQWNPAIAVNPAGTELFIAYYSRQDDTNDNALINAYGVKARLDNGTSGASFVLANATFDAAPISSTLFPPMFAGNQPTNSWRFDPVWPQAGLYLDTNASYCSAPGVINKGTREYYIHFMADDYTWAAADDTYFYYAWCDRSESYGVPPNTRPDANIRIAKIKH